MATEWFIDYGDGILIHKEEPSMMIFNNHHLPNWVKSPAETPGIGERKFKVIRATLALCRKCKSNLARFLILDDPEILVGECHECKFVWYRIRPENQAG